MSNENAGPLSGKHILLNIDHHGSIVYMPPTEVAADIKKSATGGVFSALEGACYASTEILLCGCPVISTPSE
eukprot:scaffold11991_cov21-Tisochrysis_lutea.AAC.1